MVTGRHRAGRRPALLAVGAVAAVLVAGASAAAQDLPSTAASATAGPEPGTAAAAGPRAPIQERIYYPDRHGWGVWQWDWPTRGWRLVQWIPDSPGTGNPVAPPSPSTSGPAGFVRRDGTALTLAGQRLVGTGVNLFDAASGPGWSCEHASTQDELTAAFKDLRAAGARVVRFWAFQTYTAGGTDWRGMDKVIAAAKAANLLLIPTLEDGPGWCTTGPTQQAKWQIPGYYTNGYTRPYGTATRSLLEYAPLVAARYKDEPTIAAWMIMNEAETSERSADGRSALVAMARTVAGAIKRADPNHLVTLGTQGNGAPGTSGADFADLYALPELDYAEVHDWPREGDAETDVLKGAGPGGVLPDPNSATCRNLGAPVACSFAIARQLGKPLIVGELGVKTATAGGPQQRAAAVQTKVSTDLAAGASLVILWEARLPRDGGGEGFEVRPGTNDPLLKVLASTTSSGPGQAAEWTATAGPAPKASATAAPLTADAPRTNGQPPTQLTAAAGHPVAAYVTAYTYQDNTPPGARISHPIVHQQAGGAGTYDDPVTIAVGHDLSSGADVLDVPAGTRFYLPSLRRYGIVEDTCGDGPTPQNGPCHNLQRARSETGQQVQVWLDVWAGGQGATKADADRCAALITRLDPAVIRDPNPGLPLTPGPLIGADGRCAITGTP